MIRFDDSHIEALIEAESQAELRIYTLGRFELVLNNVNISEKWGRDKAIQLFQFFLISRNRTALHKEQILDRLWEGMATDQNFKVALHGINKVLDPDKKARGNSKYLIRQGSSYKLNMEQIWLDSQSMEAFLEIGNNTLIAQSELAIIAYQYAINLYRGVFLPNRIYEDWTSTEREKLQMLSLNGHISLAQLLLEEQPDECIRLTEEALNIDPAWEEAYRIQMNAHMINGNRPQAIKTFNKCKAVLEREFGIEPLPDTQSLLKRIKAI